MHDSDPMRDHVTIRQALCNGRTDTMIIGMQLQSDVDRRRVTDRFLECRTVAQPSIFPTATASSEESRPQPLARFYMTSDLRAATGLTRTHLDFYLREGVIVPTARTESGYLLFDDRELATLRQVIAWRHHGIGIREILARLARHAA